MKNLLILLIVCIGVQSNSFSQTIKDKSSVNISGVFGPITGELMAYPNFVMSFGKFDIPMGVGISLESDDRKIDLYRLGGGVDFFAFTWHKNEVQLKLKYRLFVGFEDYHFGVSNVVGAGFNLLMGEKFYWNVGYGLGSNFFITDKDCGCTPHPTAFINGIIEGGFGYRLGKYSPIK